jgi:hypothetical protein
MTTNLKIQMYIYEYDSAEQFTSVHKKLMRFCKYSGIDYVIRTYDTTTFQVLILDTHSEYNNLEIKKILID